MGRALSSQVWSTKERLLPEATKGLRYWVTLTYCWLMGNFIGSIHNIHIFDGKINCFLESFSQQPSQWRLDSVKLPKHQIEIAWHHDSHKTYYCTDIIILMVYIVTYLCQLMPKVMCLYVSDTFRLYNSLRIPQVIDDNCNCSICPFNYSWICPSHTSLSPIHGRT